MGAAFLITLLFSPIPTLKCFLICINPQALRRRPRTQETPDFLGPRKMTSNFPKKIWQESIIVDKWTLSYTVIFSYFFQVVIEVGLGPQAKVRSRSRASVGVRDSQLETIASGVFCLLLESWWQSSLPTLFAWQEIVEQRLKEHFQNFLSFPTFPTRK